MPSASKRARTGAYIGFEDNSSTVADESIKTLTRRGGRRKDGNASADRTHTPNGVAESEVAPESCSPNEESELALGQVPSALGQHDDTVNVPGALQTSRKVSDHYENRTDAWAREIPFGKSPPADSVSGVSLNGSPPVGPGFAGRAGFSTRSPPSSPYQQQVRPISYGSTLAPIPNLQYATDHLRYSPSAYGSPPAPPHMSQPHFYEAQDLDLGLPHGLHSSLTNEPTFVGVASGLRHFKDLSNRNGLVTIIGSEGALDLLLIQAERTQHIGTLAGLPGTVVNAAILTNGPGFDPLSDMRPLIAVVLHGPKLSTDEEIRLNFAGEDAQRSRATGPSTHIGTNPLEYQTRVDVYSLTKRRHITTLLRLPPVCPEYRGKFRIEPTATGCLTLATSGSYAVIASGLSGELFPFSISSKGVFESLGTVWTSLQPQAQRRDSSRSRTPDADISPADLNRGSTARSPLFSLNGRWLAFCPPSSASRNSISPTMDTKPMQVPRSDRNDRSPPPPPAVNCEVDSPDVETLLGKVVRGVTQQAVKGAGWIFDQGWQALSSYMSKEQIPKTSPRNGISPQVPSAHDTVSEFPPTHADETQSMLKEPGLVSIVDLNTLQQSRQKKGSEELKPLATFQPPGGCSYLSFAPSGLVILTASRRGDLHYIWDLMQLRYHRTAALVAEAALTEATSFTPRVRQIAKFPRYTPSTIVDIVWEAPSAERLAVLTRNGTIHLYDLPPTSLRWPPPRSPNKARPTSAPPNPVDSTNINQGGPTSGMFASALTIAGKAQPMLANLRGRPPSFGAGLSGIGQSGVGIASATGVRGSRVVTAGLSKSLGAASGTVNQIRHAGESRISLKSLATDPAWGRIAWGRYESQPTLTVLSKSAVRNYMVIKTPGREKQHIDTSVFGARKLPGSDLPSPVALARSAARQPVPNQESVESGALPGFWKPPKPDDRPSTRKLAHPLSCAEIESCATYSPFHSDPRVSLFVYRKGHDPFAQGRHPIGPANVDPTSAGIDRNSHSSYALTVFGNAIAATRLDLQSLQAANEDENEVDSVIYRQTVSPPISTAAGHVDMAGSGEISPPTQRKAYTRQEGSNLPSDPGDFDTEVFFNDDFDVHDSVADQSDRLTEDDA